jgi:GNAT superfamily N-acetyltransferase
MPKSDPERGERWRRRILHPYEMDPGGTFVAELGGRIVGVSQVIIRERLWQLSILTVEPAAQSTGAGRALMDAALTYDGGTEAGLIVSSSDPRAIRLYARAGFEVLPTLETTGQVDRRKLRPSDPHVRVGGLDDLEALAAVSREVRGGPHTPELEFALATGAMLLRYGDRGFAVVQPNWCVWLLLARDEEAATALLWSALEAVGESDQVIMRWVTAGQQWAIQVAVAAGLGLTSRGALCVRGAPGTLAPYLPSGAFA